MVVVKKKNVFASLAAFSLLILLATIPLGCTNSFIRTKNADIGKEKRPGVQQEELLAGRESPKPKLLFSAVKDQMLIKIFNMTIIAKDVEKAAEKAKDVTEKFKGFVQNENYNSAYRDIKPMTQIEEGASEKKAEIIEGYLELRIPANNVEKAVDEIKKISKILSFSRNVQDVTQPYTELSIRLDNLKAEAKRLEELYKRAATVKEILEIERELTRVRTEIETNENELTRMKHQVDYSTVILTIRKPAGIVEPSWEFDWKRVLRGFVENLVSALELLFRIIGGLIPFIVAVALVYLLYKLIKR